MGAALLTEEPPALSTTALLYDAISNIIDRVQRIGPPNQLCWRTLKALVGAGAMQRPLRPAELANLVKETTQAATQALLLLEIEGLVEPGMHNRAGWRPTPLGQTLACD